MAQDPEAQTQLARLLRDESLRAAGAEAIRAAADARFDMLVDGIVAEAAASDDVFDRESARSFVDLRARELQDVLGEQMSARLREAVGVKIEAW